MKRTIAAFSGCGSMVRVGGFDQVVSAHEREAVSGRTVTRSGSPCGPFCDQYAHGRSRAPGCPLPICINVILRTNLCPPHHPILHVVVAAAGLILIVAYVG